MHAPAERLGVLIDTCHLHAAGFASPEPGRGGPPGRCARRRGLLGRLIAFHPERLQGPRRLPARPPWSAQGGRPLRRRPPDARTRARHPGV